MPHLPVLVPVPQIQVAVVSCPTLARTEVVTSPHACLSLSSCLVIFPGCLLRLSPCGLLVLSNPWLTWLGGGGLADIKSSHSLIDILIRIGWWARVVGRWSHRTD